MTLLPDLSLASVSVIAFAQKLGPTRTFRSTRCKSAIRRRSDVFYVCCTSNLNNFNGEHGSVHLSLVTAICKRTIARDAGLQYGTVQDARSPCSWQVASAGFQQANS